MYTIVEIFISELTLSKQAALYLTKHQPISKTIGVFNFLLFNPTCNIARLGQSKIKRKLYQSLQVGFFFFFPVFFFLSPLLSPNILFLITLCCHDISLTAPDRKKNRLWNLESILYLKVF